MSFPKYEAYKDSGVEWLGAVPEYWELWKISHAFKWIGSGTTPPSNEEKWYEDGTIPWITTGELRENIVTETKKSVTLEALNKFSTLRVHPPGSLAIAMYGATIGRLGILGIHATTNQACCVMGNSSVLDAKFVFYWLQSSRDAIISLYSTGGGQPNINQESVAFLRVPAPIIEEQTQIARFLDHETARIDALIAEQQRLIELLKEKRQAVISHAVTKGLDAIAPMKDSGVEWLGEVPAHWEVVKLARALQNVEQGWSPNASNQPAGVGEWGVIKISAIKQGNLVEFENKALLEDTVPDRSIELRKGDLLVTRANTPDLVGDACVVQSLSGTHLMLSDLVYRLNLQMHIEAKFVCFFLISSYGRAQIKGDARGSSMSMAKISQGHIKGWTIALPDHEDQVKIAEYIDRRVSAINELIHEANQGILLLQERRSALISAAVTGKIDGRGWQAPASASPAPTLEPVHS